jgi:hypothetical protein
MSVPLFNSNISIDKSAAITIMESPGKSHPGKQTEPQLFNLINFGTPILELEVTHG